MLIHKIWKQITKDADITSTGDVSVTADADTTASSISKKGTSVTIVNVDVIKAKAQIGTKSKPQTVSAGISGGKIKTKTGGVKVNATNIGSATADSYKEGDFSIANVVVVELPTTSWYSTEAYIKGGADIDSGEKIEVNATDNNGKKKSSAESIAESSSIGLLLNGNNTKGSNNFNAASNIDIDGKLRATDGIDILIRNDVKLTAKTTSRGKGFVEGDKVYAENNVTRTAFINISGGSELYTNFGDISIISVIGRDDSITTYADVDSGGFVSIGDATTSFKNSAEAKVVIGGSTDILNRFGTITIKSDASMSDTSIHASSDCSGVDVEPHVLNTVESTLTSTVTIGGSGSENTKIEGRYVYITSNIGKLEQTLYTYAKGSALLNTTAITSKNDVTNTLNSTTSVVKTDIIGHDNMTI